VRVANAASAAIAAQKAALRSTVLARRDALAPAARARASERIAAAILACANFEKARVVMAYCSFASELDTSAVIAAVLASGRTLVLPWIDRPGDALRLFAVTEPATQLAANRLGIREPLPDRCTPVACPAVDFILVPGVAFDAQGGRLGHGKAYYDRLLHACRAQGGTATTVAGAFEAQIVDEVPMEPHDVAVGTVITERRRIERARAR
jgi:5-formyltetrahydrofolate cyclo-ligase